MGLVILNVIDDDKPDKAPEPLKVSGIVAKSGLGPDGQLIDRQWLGRALKRWFSMGGAVTTNFDHKPVGVCTHIFTEDGGQSFSAEVEIYDEVAKKLVMDEALKGLSIAISGAQTEPYNDKRGKVIGGRINAVSLLEHDFWNDDAKR